MEGSSSEQPKFRIKPQEQLGKQVSQVSSILGQEVTQPSSRDEVYSLSPQDLKQRFPHRYDAYLKTLRSQLAEPETTRINHTLTVLNNLDRYITDHYVNAEQATLRERQLTVFEDLRDFIEEGGTEGYVKLPTGFGKTVLFTEFVEAMDVKTLIVVPSIILLDQTEEKMAQFASDLQTGKIFGEKKEYGKQVTLTTYDSLNNGLRNGTIQPEEFDLLILDEAHRSLSPTRVENVQSFTNAIKIGLTATPIFSDDKKVSNLLNTEIHSMNLKEAVEEGLLTPFSVYLAETDVDLSQVKITASGDYDENELEKVINIESRNQAAIELYKEMFDGRAAVAYCASRKHARELAEKFRNQGVSAEVISGDMSRVEQDRIRNEYREGKINVLCNANILIEGFDEPRTSVCLNLRPTLSNINAEQRGGRALRLDPNDPNKHAYIVDFLDKSTSKKQKPITFAEIAEGARLQAKREKKGSTSESADILPPVAGELEQEESTLVKVAPKIQIEGLEVIVDADEVMRVVNAIIDERYKKAPEGWQNVLDLARSLSVHPKVIRGLADKYREENPKWYEEYISKSKRVSEHYSPQLVAEIHAKLGSRIEPPGNWSNLYKLSTDLGESYNFLQTQVERYRAEHPEWYGRYLDDRGAVSEHYSPELIAQVRNSINSRTTAPEGWSHAAGLTETLDRTPITIKKLAYKYKEEHPEWFVEYTDGQNRLLEYYSPQLIEQMRKDLAAQPPAPPGWMTPKTLANSITRSPKFVTARANKFKEEHPEWFVEYKAPNGSMSEHYSPELIAKLLEEVQ